VLSKRLVVIWSNAFFSLASLGCVIVSFTDTSDAQTFSRTSFSIPVAVSSVIVQPLKSTIIGSKTKVQRIEADRTGSSS
jgi:hypothetical protein